MVLAQPRGVGVQGRVQMEPRIVAPLVALEAVVRVAARRLHHAPGDVQLAHQRGLVAEARQVRRQQHLVVGQRVVQPVHAVPGQRLAGQHARAARRADGSVHVAALERHPAGRKRIQGRRGNGTAAVASERIPALLVAHDEQDVGAFRIHAPRACRAPLRASIDPISRTGARPAPCPPRRARADDRFDQLVLAAPPIGATLTPWTAGS